MVGIEILIEIELAKRSEFLQVFDMVKTTPHLNGKRLYLELFEQVNNQNRFLWRENWENAESLAQYHEENQFKAMLGAIDILGKLIHTKTFLIEEETPHV